MSVMLNTHQIHTQIPCHSHASSQHTPTQGHHASTHSNIPSAPQLTCSDTAPHTHNSHTLCIKTHQPTTPHVSGMHHKPAPMPTPLTWPAARGTLRHPCHLSFFTQGCCQVPGEGAATLLRPMKVPSSRETPSQSTIPQHLPFI